MVKRAFDLFFSALGLLALSPLLLLLAMAVKLTSRGPVFFRQQRVGQGGRLFYILKLRSMVVNAEKLGLSVTRDGDPRITPLGRLLRKTKLDELPQLWNVLVGDMSFVGPRPEVPGYVRQYTPGQRRVLELKPGITDLATIEFRNEEESAERGPRHRQILPGILRAAQNRTQPGVCRQSECLARRQSNRAHTAAPGQTGKAGRWGQKDERTPDKAGRWRQQDEQRGRRRA